MTRPQSVRRGLAFAATSGGLLTLASPGVGLWALGLVALVPLILVLDTVRPLNAFLFGGAAGLTFWIPASTFLLPTLERFTRWSPFVCVPLCLLIWAYLGCRLGLAAWAATVARQRGLPFGPALLLALAAAELIFPTALPWHMGVILGRFTWVAQVADLGGPIALTVLVGAANLGAAALVRSLARGRPGDAAVAVRYATLVGAAAIYGALRVHAEQARIAHAAKGRIALVQTGVGPEGLPGRYAVLNRALSLTRELERERGPFDLVVWGETAIPNAVDERYAAEWYGVRVAARAGAPLLFGAGLVAAGTHGKTFYNSALISDVSGRIRGRYDKQDLFPLGERIPFARTMPFLREFFPNTEPLSRGPRRDFLSAARGSKRIATFICYEAAEPELVNRAVRGRSFQLLVNLASDAWFASGSEARLHLEVVALRAVEHHRYLVRATTTGLSAIVDPVGRVVAASKLGEPDTLSGQVAWMDGSTPYEAWGDTPWWICAGLLFLLLAAPPLRDWGKGWRRAKARAARALIWLVLAACAAGCARAGRTEREEAGPPRSLPATRAGPKADHGPCGFAGLWRGETRDGQTLEVRVAADGRASWTIGHALFAGEAWQTASGLSIVQEFARMPRTGCPLVVGHYRARWSSSCRVLVLRATRDPCGSRRAAADGLELERTDARGVPAAGERAAQRAADLSAGASNK